MKNTEGLNRLKKDIKENDIGNCYIFYGEETYLRDYYFRKIKEILVPEAFEEFNYLMKLTCLQISSTALSFL